MARVVDLKLPTSSLKQQLANKKTWNFGRDCREADFYTVGCSGRTLQEFLEVLATHDVITLVDIRQHAVSMYRPELSKTNLRLALESQGLTYIHWPDLGVPRDMRAKAIVHGSRDVIWEWYDKCVLPGFLGNLRRFFDGLEHKVAFMCMERDPTECHRHRLATALEVWGLSGYDL